MQNPPRPSSSENEHCTTPGVVADAVASAARQPVATVAPTHGLGQTPAPLDHAAIHTIIPGVMLAMFLSALEQTIVAPALPAIGKSLGTLDNLSWVVTAYLLAATTATPLFGKLTDIHGRRAIMLVVISIFMLGSL